MWPSTGNYCRGGVAISRIMGCRGVAVLPEGMSAERFAWLGRWVSDPADIVRTRMYVTDISQWKSVGRAHGEAFAAICPATAMVEVSRLIDPDMLVEIEADAIAPTRD